jgi:hypothetical protein
MTDPALPALAIAALALFAADPASDVSGLWVERAEDGAAQCDVVSAPRFRVFIHENGPPHPRSDNLGEAELDLGGGQAEAFILDGAGRAKNGVWVLTGGRQTTIGRISEGVTDAQHTGGLRVVLAALPDGDLQLREARIALRDGETAALLPEGRPAEDFNPFSRCAEPPG